MKKSFSLFLLVCLLFAPAGVICAPTIKVIGIGTDGTDGQFDLLDPDNNAKETNVTIKNLSGTECINIADRWDVFETVTYTCTIEGEVYSDSLSGRGRVDILQNGCDISYTPPTIDAPRTGQIIDNRIILSGLFAIPAVSVVTFYQNNATITGTVNDLNQFTLSGIGVVKGTAYGVGFSCSGNSIAKFSRNSDTLNKIECLLNWAEDVYPSLFSPSGAISQFQSPYTYRYYSYTSSYVGVSSFNNHVYYLGPDGVLLDVGDLSGWLTTASCQ